MQNYWDGEQTLFGLRMGGGVISGNGSGEFKVMKLSILIAMVVHVLTELHIPNILLLVNLKVKLLESSHKL